MSVRFSRGSRHNFIIHPFRVYLYSYSSVPTYFRKKLSIAGSYATHPRRSSVVGKPAFLASICRARISYSFIRYFLLFLAESSNFFYFSPSVEQGKTRRIKIALAVTDDTFTNARDLLN